MQEALSYVAYAGGHGESVRPATEPRRAASRFEFAVVGFAMLGLVAAELMLSSAICGTNFAGGDGKMAQAIILAVYKSVVSFILTISILFRVSDHNCFRSTENLTTAALGVDTSQQTFLTTPQHA
jgi:hypothetical protein